jgi:hypothetical protein
MANEFKIKHGFISTGNGSIEGGLTITGAGYADNGQRIATRNWATQYLSDNSYATTTDISDAIDALVASAPGTLDTLNELAAALGDDPNFSTTITNSIATKLPLAGGTMSGDIRWTSTGKGLEWVMNTDGAGIKFYNTGDTDTNSRLEYYTTDNGNEYHRFMVATNEEMTIKSDGVRVTNNIYMAGNIVATQSWVSTRGYGAASDITALNERIDEEVMPLFDTKADIGHTHDYLPLAGGTLTGTLTLNATNPRIDFNGTSDASIDMSIVATPEGLDFLEPEDGNKVHFQILDDAGVNSPFGYKWNGQSLDVRYAAASHTHAYSSLTGIPTSFTPSAHTHSIEEVDGLQTALENKLETSVNPLKAASVSNDTITFTRADNTTFAISTSDANTNYYLNGITKSGNTLTFSVSGATNQTYTFGSNAFTSYTDHVGLYDALGSANAIDVRINEEVLPAIPTNVSELTNDAGYITDGNTGWNNSYGFITASSSITGNAATASKLATARNIALSGAVTGNANFDGSGNITIATTATSDPKLTLAGDASGSATFTNLGNATLTVTVANDSHTHDGRYYTESESDARFVNVTGDTVTGDLAISGATLSVTSTAEGTEAFFVDGVNGRLFTISDDLSDSLFSANTISGLPVIEAFADNTVKLGPYSNPVIIDSTGSLTIGGATAATQSYVDTSISNLIGGAPGALDTLNELAAAINDDASFASSVTSSLALKAPLASPALTGNPTAPTQATSNNSTRIATTAFVKAQGYVTTDTNYYLNGISRSGNVLTFSVNGATNQTYTFGSAAWAATTAFDAAGTAASEAGTVNTRIDNEVLPLIQTPAITSNGSTPSLNSGISAAEIRSLIGAGTSSSDTNYYLNGITKSSNTLTFAVSGTTNQTYTFGSNAFTSYSNHVGLYDSAGSAAAVDTRIDEEVLPIIQTPAITSNGSTPSLNSGISAAEIRTLIGAGTSSSDTNFYLNGITKSGNTLTFSVSGATNQTYNFGSNAFTSYGNHVGLYDTVGTAASEAGAVNTRIDEEVLPLIPTVPSNVSAFTNDAGYITDGNTNWNNSYGFITNSVTDFNVADQIIHTGDTNTYMQFHAADQWRVVTGGGERLEVNNSQVTVQNALHVNGDILLTGTATTTNQGRMIDFTGFDKEGTTDFSDRAYIQHTTNTGGHAGSVLVISSQNDSGDGIAFLTNASSKLKHNGNNIATESYAAGAADAVSQRIDNEVLPLIQVPAITSNGSVPALNSGISAAEIRSLIGAGTSSSDTNYYLSGASFNTGNGVLTLTVSGATNQTVDLDGRYQLAGSYLTTTGKAADSDKLDGLDSGAFLRSNANDTATGVISFNAGINTLSINDTSGQQLVICAGEAGIDSSQNGELVYVNAENGFQVAASNDNWATGYAGTKKTIIDYGGIRYDGNYVWHAGNFNPSSYQPAGTYNTIIGTDSDINTSGSTIIDNIYVTDGVITSMGTRTLTAANLGIAKPGPAEGLLLTIVNDTINVTFNQSPSSVDNYLIFSSVDGGDYGLISVLSPQDMGETMSVIDSTFRSSGVISYRIYAVNNGIYSDPLEGDVNFTTPAEEVANLSSVSLNIAYYVQWDGPVNSLRFVDRYVVYADVKDTQASLTRNDATLVYDGQNTNYMYAVSSSNFDKYHQFWVEVIYR